WIKLQERGRREPPKLQKLLLAEARGTNLEQRSAGFEDGQFQGGRRPLALVAVLEGEAKGFRCDGLAQQVACALGEVPLAGVPPFLDQYGVGPGKAQVRFQGGLCLGGLGWRNLNVLGRLAVQVLVSDIRAADQAERLAGHS